MPGTCTLLNRKLRSFFHGKGYGWLVNRTDCGHSDGGCLLVAKALSRIFPDSQIVTLISTKFKGMPEHYGIRWQGLYLDGTGAYRNAATWGSTFSRQASIAPVLIIDRFVYSAAIDSFIDHQDDLVTLMEKNLRIRRIIQGAMPDRPKASNRSRSASRNR
jgi:hypothetical protein